jgi:hypothetical protein
MFKNLTIKSRLIFILSFLLIFVLGIQVVGLFGMSSAIGGLKSVYHDRAIPLSQVTHIESLLLHNRLAITSALVMPTREVIETKRQWSRKISGRSSEPGTRTSRQT